MVHDQRSRGEPNKDRPWHIARVWEIKIDPVTMLDRHPETARKSECRWPLRPVEDYWTLDPLALGWNSIVIDYLGTRVPEP